MRSLHFTSGAITVYAEFCLLRRFPKISNQFHGNHKLISEKNGRLISTTADRKRFITRWYFLTSGVSSYFRPYFNLKYLESTILYILSRPNVRAFSLKHHRSITLDSFGPYIFSLSHRTLDICVIATPTTPTSSSGSGRLYRLGVSQSQKSNESGDERPRLRAP